MKIKRLMRNENGAVLPIVAFFLAFVFLGVSAIVVDAGILYNQRRQMVSAADAGALAGAKELNRDKTDEQIKAIARSVAIANGADDNESTIVTVDRTINNSYNSPHVKVDTIHNTELYFAKAIGLSSSEVKAYAVAKSEKLLNPGIIPLFMVDQQYETAGTDLQIIHDDKIDIGDITLNWSSGVLYLDGNLSGMPGVRKFLGDREIEMPESFFSNLAQGKLPGKGGIGQIDENNADDGLDLFESWFNKAALHSFDEDERRAYMTGFIPIMDSDEYILNYGVNANKNDNDTKDFPIAFFAEFVVVDYVNLQNDKLGVYTAFEVPGGVLPVEYDSIVGETNKNYFSFAEKKTIIGYFTGNTISVNDVITGNYTGTAYEEDSIRRVFLIE